MVITKINELRTNLKEVRKQNKTIGFVPTMGFLHEGHLSLIRRAREENNIVVISVFVNPTQFGPGEDFERYPRDMERDIELAYKEGANIIFNPAVEEIYPHQNTTWVEVEGDLTSLLCGTSRPAHFKGVTTVVNMLFNIVIPHKAYFGQKDAQQAAVITKMVKDLHMDINIRICPIVREEDGLALSSRNIYLKKEEREQATILYKALQLTQSNFENGETDVDTLISIIKNCISSMSLAKIEYAHIYSFPSLNPIAKIDKKAIVALAVKFGNTRLIDNIILEKES